MTAPGHSLAPAPTPAPLTVTPPGPSGWQYTPTKDGRDLRFDFLRGVVMLVMVVVHIEIFSLFSLVSWERIGVVSGAEGFVIFSGIVVGMVYGGKIGAAPFGELALKMWARSLQLYKISVAIFISVLLLRLVPFLKSAALTSFVDHGSGLSYPLLPAPGTSMEDLSTQVVMLRGGPHQTQVLGLYVALMFMAPGFLALLRARKTHWLLLASWTLYAVNTLWPSRPTGMQFEYAFPLLSWQLLFVHGVAFGFHRKSVAAWAAKGRRGKVALALAGVVFLALLFFAQNTPNRFIPAYARLHLIDPALFRRIYGLLCEKNRLGPLRIVDDAAVLMSLYWLLTRFWRPLHRALGWFFVPIGQASLYVFIMHLYVVLIVSNIVPFGLTYDTVPHMARSSFVHAGALAALWLCVRTKFLFRWIPR